LGKVPAVDVAITRYLQTVTCCVGTLAKHYKCTVLCVQYTYLPEEEITLYFKTLETEKKQAEK